MIVALPDGLAVVVSSVVWVLTSFVVGWAAARRPAEAIVEGPVTHLRGWERDGRTLTKALRVPRWKDRMPEAGAFFGGASKRRIPSRRTEDLEAFRVETVRAEKVHWSIMASTPLHAIWCPPAVFAGMALFGVAFNAPFIVIQRTNRGRIDRILRQRALREGRVVEAPRAVSDPRRSTARSTGPDARGTSPPAIG